MEVLMKGAPVATALTEKLASQVEEMKKGGITPKLAIVRVGERGDDLAYERGATKRMEKCGIDCQVYTFPADVPMEEFEKGFKAINDDDAVHGILMFRPLPKHLDEERIKSIINPLKDVDCMNSVNMAKVFMQDKTGYAPCTPEAVIRMLEYYEVDLTGKNVALIGRSLVVGKPLAMLLMGKNATVTVCHTKTKDVADITRRSDIVIAAAGAIKTVTRDMISEGTVVVDVGINVDGEGNLCGDVDYEEVENIASYISPVPAGVGSVTSTVLAEHVVRAAVALQ
ncbi:MAG: bifunctional 5,10-methylenetetrahydrofolate dehydrogenase/5,10-methenyltetrahydrofolate cyclohydrolase [Pseudobutyrivibrio sp.]|nr:bifunctional 5,10-methylenetetrahydrofolate dehydrogenase/5,10-methenyltetrahydrofolate cyclohydrolase [Pseudobutyrivibrio sp.]